jgi:hypothetical protein
VTPLNVRRNAQKGAVMKLFEHGSTETVNINGAIIKFKNISIREKFKILNALATLEKDVSIIKAWDGIIAALSDVVISINNIEFTDAVDRLVDYDSLRELVSTVITRCTLGMSQRKNSLSSPEQPFPESAGNAETNVDPDGAPVSIIPTVTEL